MGTNGFDKRPQDINRNGRPPKEVSLTDILKELSLTKETTDRDDLGNKILIKTALANKLLDLALKDGDITAIKYIYDRIDGKPIEKVEQEIRQSNVTIPDILMPKLDDSNDD